ncbi:type 2 lanthipeptide synthetase LanM family protein [Streptomyces tagetis]|uniref:Type 2 lantipeptide synthetase LanM family protein n=1 Tax=Streptomyces tagetis TaxID=2820809 RepID=A0A940XEA0_9ACTN|nr:type 2 lanthipeptide synthetase LanM family protein [Streptomyces sp. RG38]MBQ0826666.1 type 2 lantipeptide synthetase LanM family protein [Streptomyces sp. RG38]
MTETAGPPAPRSTALPPSWWAPALSLAERLAAPGLPGAPAEAAAGPAPWAAGDAEGFALRLAHLGVEEATAAALAAEPAERLAARAAKPDWARYTEAVLAGAFPEPAGRGGEGPDAFAPVVRPLVAAATARLAGLLPAGAEQDVWREAFARRLTRQLVRQAARTLVHELDSARRGGRLAGAGPRERFDAFVAATGTRQGLGALFASRPVLARMLAQTSLDATAATAELAARFAADREELTARLLGGRDPGPLTGVDLGLGDAHEGNRSVAVLRFAGERLVHKPRPLGQHALLDELVAWLNAKVPGLELRTPRSLRREAYGWLEFVEHRWCRSVTETDAFYRRQGALLALLYTVDGADMHYENVIACGDQPVLVDAETLLHTGLAQAVTAGADPAAEALRASVHRTCLLPHLLIGEHGALDISALGRSTDGTYPSEGLHWRDSGLDTMRAVRGPLLSPAAQNQPLPAGRLLEGADHRAALLEGFRAAYAALAADGDELLREDGPLMSGADRPARLVARATRLYATLLEESAHPSLLGDALAREGVFAVLWTESEHDEPRRRLIEHETAALWRGDVPLFTHRPSGTAVRADDGTWLPGLLPVAGVASVREKIARMDEVDCHDQEWIITATIAARGAGSPLGRPRSELAVEPVPAVAPDPSRLLAAVCGIADEIAARAVRDGDRTNWLGLERVSGPHWAVLPMGAGLAQGYCGVALFLAHTDALAGAGRYTALAREAIRPLPALLKALADDPELSAAAGPGAYDGLGGIVYAVLRLSALLGPEPAECLPDALTALGHAASASSDPGFATGTAGALTAAVAVHEATGDPAALRLATALADRLLGAVSGPEGAPGAAADARGLPGGFADGGAGIAWALLRYAARLPRRTAAHTAAARTLLETASRGTGDASWSGGLAGAAAVAAHLPPVPGSPAAAWPVDPETRPDLSLGQGTLGTLEALAVRAGRGEPAAAAPLARHTGRALALVEARNHRCATPDRVPSPGLLDGLSGIGYGLLRLAHPGTVPSVLLLSHPGHRPARHR